MAQEVDQEVKVKTPLAIPEDNPLAHAFYELAAQVSSAANKQELENLGLTEANLNQIFEDLKNLFGLEKGEGENLYQFFDRVWQFIYANFPQTGKAFNQGIVPQNLPELISALERREAVINQIRENLGKVLEKYGLPPTEVSQWINHLLEIRAGQIETKAGEIELSPQEKQALAQASFQGEKPFKKKLAQTVLPQEIKEELAGIPRTNPYFAATATLAHQITHPPSEVAEITPPSITNLPPSQSFQTASSLMPFAWVATQTPESAIPFVASNLALNLAAYEIILSGSEGENLVKNILPIATPVWEKVAQDFTPAEVQAWTQEDVQQAVTGYFLGIGLDPGDSVVTQVIEIAARHFSTPPSIFTRAVATTSLPEEPAISETTASLPPKPNNFFTTLYPIQGSLPWLYNRALVSQMPGLETTTASWGDFRNYPGYTTDPLITYLDSLYRPQEDGIGYQISRETLYKFSQIFRPLVELGKKKIFQKLAQTAIGQAVRKGVEKAALALAKKLALDVVKGTAIKGGTAAVAAILGIPTGGASILIWLAIELGAKLLSKLKQLLKTGVALLDKISFGLLSDVRNWIKENIGEFAAKAFDFLSLALAPILAPLTMVAVTPILIFALVAIFGVLLFMSFRHQQTLLTLTPPLGRGGEGITQEQFGTNLIEITNIDMGQCQSLSGAAQRACALTLVFKECSLGGFINAGNTDSIEDCIRGNDYLMSILNEDMIQRIVSTLTRSASLYQVLQCVGFKAAVEPALPGCGDAKNFINGGCGHCQEISPANIQSGDNAVWTWEPYGHIAIIIGINQESGLITVAQAWGGSGRINFTQVNIVGVAEFIRCY